MSDIDLVIRRSREIEETLETRFGAKGKGLHQKLSSVEQKLPPDLVKQIRWIATMRNEVVHTSTILPDPEAYDQASLQALSRLQELPADPQNSRPSARWLFLGTAGILGLICLYAVMNAGNTHLPHALFTHRPTAPTLPHPPLPDSAVVTHSDPNAFHLFPQKISITIDTPKSIPLPINTATLRQHTIHGNRWYLLQAEIFDATMHAYHSLPVQLHISAGGLRFEQRDRLSFSPAIQPGQFRRIWLSLGYQVSQLERSQHLPLVIHITERGSMRH